MKKKIAIGLIILTLMILALGAKFTLAYVPQNRWPIMSIDTMKYSRDLALVKLDDPSFDSEIDNQMKLIAQTNANYVAIATPYDEKFVPFLSRWVACARKYHLKVWFRGNFSGWEKWFDFAPISRQEHLQLTKTFLIKHQELFASGDIFTSCTECENGGPGDPRQTGDVQAYRQFLIDEANAGQDIFQAYGKKVSTNYFPMNADVAKIIMDPATTKQLGSLIVIDHYVQTPAQLAHDVKSMAVTSGGNVVLGEFGAPIPDINGNMTDKEQAQWLGQTLSLLAKEPRLVGLNYWVDKGGSTALWQDSNSPKPAVAVLKSFYSPLYRWRFLPFR